MTTLCRTYSTEVAARRATDAMRATDVPARDFRLLAGSTLCDIRREAVGGFAGPVAPDDRVGTYCGSVPRGQGAGSYASNPDGQRQGSFADADRVVIVTYRDDRERARVTGLRGARRLLARAALDDVDRTANELQRGHSVVLVDLREMPANEARELLERVPRAA